MTDFSAIHAASDARGGAPVDQALAAVATWQRQQRAAGAVHGSMTRLLLGLSAIDTGLALVDVGRVDSGVKCARAGLEFLRKELGA